LLFQSKTARDCRRTGMAVLTLACRLPAATLPPRR
jgi:hypothetical protein